MCAADPGQVVDPLEYPVSVGIGTLRTVAERAESLDGDLRNPKGFGRRVHESRDIELSDHVAHEGKLAPERVEEMVVAKTEFIDHGRRDRQRIGDHELVDLSRQLCAIELQGGRNLQLSAIAVPSKPG